MTSLPIHIFTGLSITHSQAQTLAPPHAFVHAPIRRGDISKILAIEPRPGTFLIIDGVFHTQEALTLTEIREATSQGWEVQGCSSIGALRALEALPLGMKGYGTVYRWLRLFGVEDDDEVAQTLDPETCEPLSLAMVDIRWQVLKLCKLGWLTPINARRVIQILKSLYYPQRTELELIRQVREFSKKPITTRPTFMWDQAPKHRDAVRRIRTLSERGP